MSCLAECAAVRWGPPTTLNCQVVMTEGWLWHTVSLWWRSWNVIMIPCCGIFWTTYVWDYSNIYMSYNIYVIEFWWLFSRFITKRLWSSIHVGRYLWRWFLGSSALKTDHTQTHNGLCFPAVNAIILLFLMNTPCLNLQMASIHSTSAFLDTMITLITPIKCISHYSQLHADQNTPSDGQGSCLICVYIYICIYICMYVYVYIRRFIGDYSYKCHVKATARRIIHTEYVSQSLCFI